MKWRIAAGVAATALTLAALIGCGAGGTGTGGLSVRMIDSSAAAAARQDETPAPVTMPGLPEGTISLKVRVEAIRVVKLGGGEEPTPEAEAAQAQTPTPEETPAPTPIPSGPNRWEFDTPVEVDLANLSAQGQMLVEGLVLDAGRYKQFGLVLTDDPVFLEVEGQDPIPVRTPSGANVGIRFPLTFEVPEGGDVTLVLDWNTDRSVVHPTGGGEYVIQPTSLSVTVEGGTESAEGEEGQV